ncbi:MAG: lipid-A-disaccharide synthase, partial [Spirochaetia bacterium]|nr:lipid-A-disaccharide synthase [Spirochaetia bacterium]
MSTITPISKNILIVAGDVSGDIHAASLVRALKAADPEVRVTAIGGKP